MFMTTPRDCGTVGVWELRPRATAHTQASGQSRSYTRKFTSSWDVTSARAYAQVVYAASDALLERLTPADLRRAVDLRSVGLGRPDATWVLNRFVVFEIAMACGELSSIGRHASARLAAHRLEALPHAVASRNGRSSAAMQTPRGSPALVQPPQRHVSHQSHAVAAAETGTPHPERSR
jgi:hypothetical protein